MLRRALAIRIVAIVALPSLTLAQNVLVVDGTAGPGSSFTQIQPAIDAAADGDVILVRSGTYDRFSIVGKSLSMVADAGAMVLVLNIFQSDVRSLAPEQRVEIQRIGFLGGPLAFLNDAGPVWLDRVVVQGSPFTFGGTPGVRISSCTSVTFLGCSVKGASGFAPQQSGGGLGLDTTGSVVVAYDSTFTGGPSATGPVPLPGGDGANFHASGWAFASGCKFQGGVGTSGGGAGAITGLPLYSIDSSFVGAQAASGLSINPGGSHTPLPGPPRHFAAASPVRELQSTTLDFQGVPGEIAAVLLADLQDPAFLFLPLNGALVVSLGNVGAFAFGPLGEADGALSVSVPMPDFLPAMHGGRIYFQSFFFDPGLAYAALGPASLFVLLDSAL